MRERILPADGSINRLLARMILILLAIVAATSDCAPANAESIAIRTIFAGDGFSVSINGDTIDKNFRVCALTNINIRKLQEPPQKPLISLITDDWAGPRFIVFDPHVIFKRSQAIVLVDGTSWTLAGLIDGHLFAIPIDFGVDGYYITDALKHGKMLKIDTGENGRTYTVDLYGFNDALRALTECNIYLIDHPHG
jgi:hypothetical protein